MVAGRLEGLQTDQALRLLGSGRAVHALGEMDELRVTVRQGLAVNNLETREELFKNISNQSTSLINSDDKVASLS